MGIGINAMGNTAGGQMSGIQKVDSVSRNIENKIFDMQRKMQQLSSEEDIPEEEKMRERQELQQEIAKLNAKLRQQQAEADREKRQEELAKETQAEAEAETQNRGVEYIKSTYNKSASTDTEEMISARHSARQISDRGKIVAKIEGGIVVLKGEIKQDEIRGEDVEGKKAELAKQEKRAQRAQSPYITVLDETRESLKKAAQAKADGTGEKSSGRTEADTRDKVLIKSVNYSKEKNQEQQQQFYVSLGIHNGAV